MRMMNFILPLLKLSNRVRDALIEVLRKAMTKYVPYNTYIHILFQYIYVPSVGFQGLQNTAHGYLWLLHDSQTAEQQ